MSRWIVLCWSVATLFLGAACTPPWTTPAASPEQGVAIPPTASPQQVTVDPNPEVTPLLPDQAPSSNPAAPPPEESPLQGGQPYQNVLYGFRLHLPEGYQVREQVPSAEGDTSRPLAAWVVGPPATPNTLMLPPLTIHVYAPAPELTLAEWVARHDATLLGEPWEQHPYPVKEGEGLLFRSRNYSAPGQQLYLRGSTYLYHLVPLGPEGERLLATFEPN